MIVISREEKRREEKTTRYSGLLDRLLKRKHGRTILDSRCRYVMCLLSDMTVNHMSNHLRVQVESVVFENSKHGDDLISRPVFGILG